MSAEIVPFVPRQSKTAPSTGLHRSLGLHDFSDACRKLADSLRDLTLAARDAAAKLQMVKGGADMVASDDMQRRVELVRGGKR